MTSVFHNFIHIPTEHSLTHFCSHFRVWEGLQPPYSTRARPGSHGSVERLRCAKAVEDTAARGVTCSFPAARRQLLPAARLCWIRDCCSSARQEEMRAPEPALPGRGGIQLQTQHIRHPWEAREASIRQCHVLLVSHAGHFSFCQFSRTWEEHPVALNNVKVVVGSEGLKDWSALGKGPFHPASAADPLCPHLPEIQSGPSTCLSQ